MNPTELQRAVEAFAAIQCVVIGLSHLLQPRAWVDFFIGLRGKGHAGAFINGFLSLGFGTVLAACHPVWEGPGLGLTLLGWAQVAKALMSFCWPERGLRLLERVKPERAYEFQIAGGVLLAIGVYAAWLAWGR